ncbi:2614_t:CDS:10, partial [Cetraspora pellucida]
DLVNKSQEDTLMIDAQTNKNVTREDQWLKDSHINDYFKISKRKRENKKSSDEYSNSQEKINEIRFNEAVEYEINSARNNESDAIEEKKLNITKNTVNIETSFSLNIPNDIPSSVLESQNIRNEASSIIDQSTDTNRDILPNSKNDEKCIEDFQTSSNDPFSKKNNQIIEDSQIEQTDNRLIAESDHDNISVCGSTTISKCYKMPFYYAEELKNLRKKKGKAEIFESNPVTNITPSEMIEVKLNARYFFKTTEEDYNLLIKELLKNSEFTEFCNPKGAKVLELVNIAKKI